MARSMPFIVFFGVLLIGRPLFSDSTVPPVRVPLFVQFGPILAAVSVSVFVAVVVVVDVVVVVVVVDVVVVVVPGFEPPDNSLMISPAMASKSSLELFSQLCIMLPSPGT